MICPTCHNVMIVVEHEHIELDYCPVCSGTWFDSGELELMLEGFGMEDSSLFLTEMMSAMEAKTTEKKRKCPICKQKMKKMNIGKKPEVLIDECPRGDGVWFDSGEIGRVITQHIKKPDDESDSQERILTFLEDTFKIEDIREAEQ